MNVRLLALLIASCGLAGGSTIDFAGTPPNQDQNQRQQTVEPMEKTPVFRVNVVSRSTKAVDYRHRGGSTRVDLKGTDLMPRVDGEARVESKQGRLEINAKLSGLETANKFGLEYVTYVLGQSVRKDVPTTWEKSFSMTERVNCTSLPIYRHSG